MLAVSKKFTPASRAVSITEWLVSSSAAAPKFMVPRQRRLTLRAVRPRRVWSMSWVLAGGERVTRPTRSRPLMGGCAKGSPA